MTLDLNVLHFQRTSSDPEERVHILVQFRKDVTALSTLCEVTAVAGDVAAVFVAARDLGALGEHPEVVFVESARALKDETDISAVAINLAHPDTATRTIPGDGRGAIIGVIDSGFELTHPSLTDSRNRTRVLAAWDQVKDADDPAGASPYGFGYGIEYTREQIDGLLAAQSVLVVRSQAGAGAHGTNVAGIAAGNGRPFGLHRGIAPEAELVLVAYRNDVPIGGSAYVLDAIYYIQKHASARRLPAVINISQGDNLGAHDGASLLERAIDNVVAEGRTLVVVSAGNERGGRASHHARGRVEQGGELALSFALLPSRGRPVDGDTIDLWYRGGDLFAVALEKPDGTRSRFVGPGQTLAIEYPNGRKAWVYSETDYTPNGDNHIIVMLEKSEEWEAGVWQLILRGDRVLDGEFDAWADRPNTTTLINFQSHQEGADATTVTLPGNARRAITVGGFISRPSARAGSVEVRGDFAPGSSVGPTRDGRLKPDLTAPSTLIMAPRVRLGACPPPFEPRSGTSMAAPHVSGVVALLWALWPNLTAGQIRDALLSTAREDMFTGATPNPNWGYGKLDAAAAYKALTDLVKKGEMTVKQAQANAGVQPPVFEFDVKPAPRGSRGLVGMRVRIEVKGDGAFTITGEAQGGTFDGTLVMRERLVAAEGGDECWINGVWHNPCPATTP